MTISGDYVFSGDLGRAYHEDDRPDPRTMYCISKLAAELPVRRHGPRCCAASRPAWLRI
jgi:dTDP-4-dehydrorhamnose reductase